MVKRISIGIDEDKRAKLFKLAEQTGRPVGDLVREGIDRVLDLAEAQQRTLDRVLKNGDNSNGNGSPG